MDHSAAGGEPGMMMSYTKDGRMLNLVLATNESGTTISVTTGSQ